MKMIARLCMVTAVAYFTSAAHGADKDAPLDGWRDLAARLASATANEPNAESRSDPKLAELYQRALPSVCWIHGLSNAKGEMVMGTGWVVDADRRLIVTNEHVVGKEEHLVVCFPQETQGRLEVSPDVYLAAQKVPNGTIIATDAARDLALIQVTSLPATARSLPLARKEPENGEQVFTIAGLAQGSEGLWGMSVGYVRLSYRRSHANDGVCQVIETDLPANRGNSGGATLNMQGEVVGVFEGFQLDARLVTMSIAASEVRGLCAEVDHWVEPRTAEQFHERGVAHYYAHRYGLAAADYRRAIELKNDFAEAIGDQAWLFFERGDHLTAKAAFERALRADKENVNALNGLGCVLCALKQYPDSMLSLSQAIALAPEDAKLYRNRGVTADYLGDRQLAIADLARATGLSPNDASYHRLHGDFLRKAEQFPAAVDAYVASLKLDPDQAETWFQLGYILQKHRNYDRAIFALSQALELEQDHGTLNVRGNCYHAQGNHRAAAQDYIAAIELSQNNSVYFYNLGSSLYALAEFAKALDCFNRAIELAPHDAGIYDRRADTFEKLGNAKAANADRLRSRNLTAKR